MNSGEVFLVLGLPGLNGSNAAAAHQDTRLSLKDAPGIKEIVLPTRKGEPFTLPVELLDVFSHAVPVLESNAGGAEVPIGEGAMSGLKGLENSKVVDLDAAFTSRIHQTTKPIQTNGGKQ
jgi:hypothetical protein